MLSNIPAQRSVEISARSTVILVFMTRQTAMSFVSTCANSQQTFFREKTCKPKKSSNKHEKRALVKYWIRYRRILSGNGWCKTASESEFLLLPRFRSWFHIAELNHRQHVFDLYSYGYIPRNQDCKENPSFRIMRMPSTNDREVVHYIELDKSFKAILNRSKQRIRRDYFE